MTSIRSKRTSKAPTRFSSDNDGAETISSTGETILDYTNNTTKTTHTMSPVSKAIRLKIPSREPLKVKLPKLKRTLYEEKTKDKPKQQQTNTNNNSEIRIHKIKLPSLHSKKTKQQKTSASSSSKVNNNDTKPTISSTSANQSGTKYSGESLLLSSKQQKLDAEQKPIAPQPTPDPTGDDLDISATSKASQDDQKSNANTSFNSSNDGDANASGMKIVVSQPDASSGSEIRCPCGVDDDLGVMVECERCSTWQHGHCINVGTEADAEEYEGYICAYCHFPKDRFRESLVHLTVGDKYQARFDQLGEVLESSDNKRDELVENNSLLTLDELSQAIKELNRVLNSLRTKWKLVVSQAYEAELRIWQNPFWADVCDATLPEKEKSTYFMDQCKRNLKMNLRNMIRKMEKRCRLIEYAIKLADNESMKKNSVDLSSHEMKVKSLSQSLKDISGIVKEYKHFATQVLAV